MKTILQVIDVIESIIEAVLCPDIVHEKYGIEHWKQLQLYDAQ